MRTRVLLPTFALAAALGGHATSAHADLMTACAPEVSRYCSGVEKGRGRVSACLASHSDRLGAACLPEVQAVTSSRLVPGSVRKIFEPGFRAELPQACEAAAAKLCPGVPQGDGRVFACLYAYTSRVGEACSTQAEAALKAD